MKKITLYIETIDTPALHALPNFIQSWNYDDSHPLAAGKFVFEDVEIEILSVTFKHPEKLNPEAPLDVQYQEMIDGLSIPISKN